jgi:sugar phosphate isomerase/epimerase
MTESMYGYMKVSTITNMSYPQTGSGDGPIAEVIEKLALDPYFTGVEVGMINDPKVRKRVAAILTQSGMAVGHAAHGRLFGPGLSLCDLDEEARGKAVAAVKEGIDQSYEIGASCIVFHSTSYKEECREEAYQALVASTKELCRYAHSLGELKVLIEVFDYDMDKRCLIGPAKLAGQYARDITREFGNFGLVVDLSHLPCLRETPEEAIMPVKEYLVGVHIGNAVVEDPSLEAYGDNHPRFGFPHSAVGIEDICKFFRLLLDIGILNKENPPIVSFEIKPREYEDPDIVLANAKRYLNEAWARL